MCVLPAPVVPVLGVVEVVSPWVVEVFDRIGNARMVYGLVGVGVVACEIADEAPAGFGCGVGEVFETVLGYLGCVLWVEFESEYFSPLRVEP